MLLGTQFLYIRIYGGEKCGDNKKMHWENIVFCICKLKFNNENVKNGDRVTINAIFEASERIFFCFSKIIIIFAVK